MWFTHKVKHLVACVLWSDFELSADMMLYKLLKELVILIFHHIVVSYTRADKYTLDIFYRADLSQHFKILAVVDLKRGTRLRSKAFFTLAQSGFFLLVAGSSAEICGRSSDIMDISLEAGFLSKVYRLIDNRFFTSCLYSSALVQSN